MTYFSSFFCLTDRSHRLWCHYEGQSELSSDPNTKIEPQAFPLFLITMAVEGRPAPVWELGHLFPPLCPHLIPGGFGPLWLTCSCSCWWSPLSFRPWLNIMRNNIFGWPWWCNIMILTSVIFGIFNGKMSSELNSCNMYVKLKQYVLQKPALTAINESNPGVRDDKMISLHLGLRELSTSYCSRVELGHPTLTWKVNEPVRMWQRTLM